MLSDTAEYALRATLYIAQHATDGHLVRTDDVAASLQVPRNYLSKILHILGKEGVVVGVRGPQGGFRLAEDADRIVLARVVEPFDDLKPRTCILGRARCSDRNPCPAHHRWAGIAATLRQFFSGTTLGDLLKEGGSLH